MDFPKNNTQSWFRFSAVTSTITDSSRWLAATLLLLFSISGHAANSAEFPPSLDMTEVSISLWDIWILEIDDKANTFEIDATVTAEWHDHRLAFNPEDYSGHTLRRIEGEAATEALKTEIWWPNLEIADARGPRVPVNISIEVDSDGYVRYQERFLASISQTKDFSLFPFDDHEISFTINPFSNGNIHFVPFPDDEGENLQNIPDSWGWISDAEFYIEPSACVLSGEDQAETVELVENSVGEGDSLCSTQEDCGAPGTYCTHVEEGPEGNWYRAFPAATVAVEIERTPTYYLTSIIIPMMLIVLISSAVFWMNFETTNLSDRLSVTFTSILTVVAFDFVAGGDLPRLWYSTALNHFLTMSYLFLTVNVIENVLVSKLDARRAASIDRLFRWMFPLVYLLFSSAALNGFFLSAGN